MEEFGIYCLCTDVMNQIEEMTGRQKLEPGNRAHLTCLAQQLTTVLLLSLSSVRGPHTLTLLLTHSIRFHSLISFSIGLLKTVCNCHSGTSTLGHRPLFYQHSLTGKTYLWRHFCKIILCCFLHFFQHFQSEISSKCCSKSMFTDDCE